MDILRSLYNTFQPSCIFAYHKKSLYLRLLFPIEYFPDFLCRIPRFCASGTFCAKPLHPISIPANSETLRATANGTQERSNSPSGSPLVGYASMDQRSRCQPHADGGKDCLRSERLWESQRIG